MNLAFDIGSNIGKTVDILRQNFKKVISFEPNPRLVNLLKQNYENKNVVVDGRAISFQNGIQEFKISNADTISTLSKDWVENSRFSESYNWNTSIMVETLTLEKAIEEYGVPEYIKIDTEGYEYEILTNFNQFLPNTIFSFEWAEEQKDKINQSLIHLKNLGYQNFGFTESDPILFDDQINWELYENFKLIDRMDSERKSLWGMIYFKK